MRIPTFSMANIASDCRASRHHFVHQSCKVKLCFFFKSLQNSLVTEGSKVSTHTESRTSTSGPATLMVWCCRAPNIQGMWGDSIWNPVGVLGSCGVSQALTTTTIVPWAPVTKPYMEMMGNL